MRFSNAHRPRLSPHTPPPRNGLVIRIRDGVISTLERLPSDFIFLLNCLRRTWNRIAKSFDHDRWRALRRGGIHVPPVAISAVLLALNLLNIYYEDIGDSNQNARFNALQFAAKIHELLITASLSAVILTYLQFSLKFGRGLSLGGVLVAFQITNPTSIFNTGLWTRRDLQGFEVRRFLFALVVIASMVLAAVVGPSSAILMLPSTGWWETSLSTNPSICSGCEGIHFFLASNSSTLWPTEVSLANFLPGDCNFTNESIPQHCPGGGISSLLEQTFRLPFGNVNLTIPTKPRYVVGYDRPLASSNSLAGCLQENNTESDLRSERGEVCALARTTAIAVDQMLQWGIAPLPDTAESQLSDYYTKTIGKNVRYHLSLLNGTGALAPQTASICRSRELNTWSYKNPTAEDLVFPSRSGVDWTANASILLKSWQMQDTSKAIWIEPVQMANNTPSLAMALIFATNASRDDTGHIIPASTNLVTCSLYASWQPIEVYIDSGIYSSAQSPTNQKLFEDTITSLIAGKRPVKPKVGDGLHVQLDIDWANSALPTNQTIVRLLEETSNEDWAVDELVSTSLSLLIADSMARISMDVNGIFAVDSYKRLNQSANTGLPSTVTPVVMLAADINPQNTTALSTTTLRNGYSYSITGTTRRRACALLLAHIIIAFIHTVLVVGYGWRCPGLKSLCDLLMLAIDSPPLPLLKDHEKQDEKTEIKKYKYNVKLREDIDLQLQIILEDPRKPSINALD